MVLTDKLTVQLSPWRQSLEFLSPFPFHFIPFHSTQSFTFILSNSTFLSTFHYMTFGSRQCKWFFCELNTPCHGNSGFYRCKVVRADLMETNAMWRNRLSSTFRHVLSYANQELINPLAVNTFPISLEFEVLPSRISNLNHIKHWKVRGKLQ